MEMKDFFLKTMINFTVFSSHVQPYAATLVLLQTNVLHIFHSSVNIKIPISLTSWQ